MKSGMQLMFCTRSLLHALQAEHSFSFWDLEAFFDCPRPRLLTIGAQTVHRSDPQMSSLRVSVCACMNMRVYVYVCVIYVSHLPVEFGATDVGHSSLGLPLPLKGVSACRIHMQV